MAREQRNHQPRRKILTHRRQPAAGQEHGRPYAGALALKCSVADRSADRSPCPDPRNDPPDQQPPHTPHVPELFGFATCILVAATISYRHVRKVARSDFAHRFCQHG